VSFATLLYHQNELFRKYALGKIDQKNLYGYGDVLFSG